MRHQLRIAGGTLDAGHIRTGLRGIADKNGEADRRREGCEWLPVYVFLEDRSEISFAGLVGVEPLLSSWSKIGCAAATGRSPAS